MREINNDYEQEREGLQRLKTFVRLNTGNMATILVCAVFFCTAFFQPGHRDDITLWEIFLNSFLAFCASTAINSLYNNKAIVEGLAHPDVVDAAGKHNERIDTITEENAIDDLDVWCREANRKNYRNQRTRILSKAGLSYLTCFTEDAEPRQIEIPVPKRKEIKRLGWRMWRIRKATAKRQTRAFSKAVYLKLTELSAGELTGEGGNRNDPYNLGRGIAEYRKQGAAKNTASKVVLAVISGYMAVDLIADFSWFNLMVRAVQIAMFLVFGFLQYLNTMDYMTGEYKERLVRKGRLLLKFLSERKQETARAAEAAERSEDNTNEREVPDQLGGGDHVAAAPSKRDGQLHAAAS